MKFGTVTIENDVVKLTGLIAHIVDVKLVGGGHGLHIELVSSPRRIRRFVGWCAMHPLQTWRWLS